MDFALICRDRRGKVERRMAARAEHMAGLKTAKADGTIIDGGAMLDDAGNIVGSVVPCRFPDRAALDDYLTREPYGASRASICSNGRPIATGPTVAAPSVAALLSIA